MSDETFEKALRAYSRKCERDGAIFSNPANDSGVENIGGQDYIVLRNVNGILAVYRISKSGRIVAANGILKELAEAT